MYMITQDRFSFTVPKSIFLGQQVTLQVETSDMIYWPYFGSNEKNK